LKRIVTFAFAMMMAITCCLGAVSAVRAEDVGTRASFTLSDYNAVLKAGTTSGEIRISYTVLASKPADSVGVSSITIYKSDGSHVTTITGTTGNGLILNSDVGHAGTYSYKGTSGVSYYAVATVFAKVGTISDSRLITTATVKAP
jgi:hypothetical protein